MLEAKNGRLVPECCEECWHIRKGEQDLPESQRDCFRWGKECVDRKSVV